MNDFDFEELDKAVNELATRTHEEHGGSDQPDQTATSSVPVIVKPAAIEPAVMPPVATESSRKPVEPSKVASSPVVEPPQHTRLSDIRPRSRGSFMDIVAPPARKPGGHVGLSIQPISKPEDVVPQRPHETAAKRPSEPVVHESLTPANPVKPESRPVETAPEIDSISWPDPLDFNDGAEVAAKDHKEPAPVEPTSPFLAEAKVEKRPLGAFSNFRPKPDSPPDDKSPEPQQEIKDELTPEADGIFKEPVPAQHKQTDKAPTASEAKETPSEEPTKPDMHSAAMMAIPEQYHAQAKTVDKTVRPVFDTKEYHPPLLEATSERRGGSMWVKLFIALIVVALLGAAGYFVYLYVAR